MANSNRSGLRVSELQPLISDQEVEDIANGLTASLDAPQTTPQRALSAGNWMPVSDEQWQSFQRQKKALEEANYAKDFPGYHEAVRKSMTDEVSSAKILGNEQPSVVTAGGSPPVIDGATIKQNAKIRTPIQVSTATQVPTAARTPANLDELITDMQLKLALQAPSLNEADGDTYVFLDPPPQQPELDDVSYKHYCQRSRTPMVMKSSTLFELQSTYFEKALGPTAQFRILRRRGLLGKLPSKIKYVLDLTPAVEGDDVVHLLSEMCCSEGVRKWAIAGNLWPISKAIIGGQDEYTTKNTGINISGNGSGEVARDELCKLNKEGPLLLKHEEEPMRLPLEYTPIRHQFAIIRTLLAISGIDPGLDSAPKVWTTCAIASSFDVRSDKLRDYVVTWLHRNSYFIEVLPEVSLRMADKLACHNLCRNAFAILVGEEAFESIFRTRINNPRMTAYGRRKEDLPEEYRTRIEYASKAFIDRIRTEFDNLKSGDWLCEIPEFQNLSKMTPVGVDITESIEQIKATVSSFKDSLKRYIHGSIYRLLCADYHAHGARNESDYTRTNALFPIKGSDDLTAFWNGLMPKERVFTFSFWRSLSIRRLFDGPTNMSITGGEGYLAPIDRHSDAEQQEFKNNSVAEMRMSQLKIEVDYLEVLRSHQMKRELGSKRFRPSLVHPNFDLRQFFVEVEGYLKKVSARMTAYTEADCRRDSDHVPLLDILGCLDETEFKYLPLWAGGCDDDTGGVFDDDLPAAAAGFSQPGPMVHIGPDSTVGSSDYSFIRGPDTHNTSTMTNTQSQTRASSDAESMYRGIVISHTGNARSTDNMVHNNPSNCGDSEYDFGSISSIDDAAATEKPPAAHSARDGYAPSARSYGKSILRGRNDMELEAANTDCLEREAAERAENLGRRGSPQTETESYDSMACADEDTEIKDSSTELGDDASIIDGDSDYDKLESFDSDEEL